MNAAWKSDNRTPSARLELALCEILDWNHNADQKLLPHDATDVLGTRLEIKFDRYSIENSTPTFFCEITEHFHGTSKQKSFGAEDYYNTFDKLVLITKRNSTFEIHTIPAEHVKSLAEQPYPTRTTRSNINGNANGRYATGKLIPFVELLSHPGVVTVALPPEFNPVHIYNGKTK